MSTHRGSTPVTPRGGWASLRRRLRAGGPSPTTATADGRLAYHAYTRLAVDGEGDQRRPHRDSLEEVRRAVDRVDDPLAGAVAFRAVLLAQDAVAGGPRRCGPGSRARRPGRHPSRSSAPASSRSRGRSSGSGRRKSRRRGRRVPGRERGRRPGWQLRQGRSRTDDSSRGTHVKAPATHPGVVDSRASRSVLLLFYLGAGYRNGPRYAPLAQLAEQLTLNQWVPGSSPGGAPQRIPGRHLECLPGILD